jgi:hypothetical protein
MTHRLTFTPTYPGGRILLMLGQHEIGEILPPPQADPMARPYWLSPYWRWRFWMRGAHRTSEGFATCEQAAKKVLVAEAIGCWARARKE